jgi:hypothetical protein
MLGVVSPTLLWAKAQGNVCLGEACGKVFETHFSVSCAAAPLLSPEISVLVLLIDVPCTANQATAPRPLHMHRTSFNVYFISENIHTETHTHTHTLTRTHTHTHTYTHTPAGHLGPTRRASDKDVTVCRTGIVKRAYQRTHIRIVQFLCMFVNVNLHQVEI